MSILRYKATWFALQSVVLGAPLLVGLVDPQQWFVFPPMGDEILMWQTCTFVIASLAGLLPIILTPKKGHKFLLVSLFVLILVSCTAYIWQRSARVVPIPIASGDILHVIKGERRTDLSPYYRELPDRDLIEYAGLHDSELEHVYTATSLLCARWYVFLPFVALLSSVECLLGMLSAIFVGLDGSATVSQSNAGP